MNKFDKISFENMTQEQFYNFSEKYFDFVSKKYMNRMPGVYHPDDRLFKLAQSKGVFCLPAHFYTPIPSVEEIKQYDDTKYTTKGLDWNESTQLEFLRQCAVFQNELDDITLKQMNDVDFYWDNSSFSHSDAAFYYSLIRNVKPGRIIEIGAGNSTKMAVKALKQENAEINRKLSVIEPYPSKELLAVVNKFNLKLERKRLQDVDLHDFSVLGKNDILFYDGSHVSKYGSDVNHFILNVLPVLNSGVFVHIHDIFLPSDMVRSWVENLNIFWNEQYLLHAFLMFNDTFEVIFSSNYMKKNYSSTMDECLRAPLRFRGNGGGSIWIRKK